MFLFVYVRVCVRSGWGGVVTSYVKLCRFPTFLLTLTFKTLLQRNHDFFKQYYPLPDAQYYT